MGMCARNQITHRKSQGRRNIDFAMTMGRARLDAGLTSYCQQIGGFLDLIEIWIAGTY